MLLFSDRNTKLISERYHAEYLGESGHHEEKKNCFYTGYVDGFPLSKVPFSLCKHGIQGIIRGLINKPIYIEPYYADILSSEKMKRKKRSISDFIQVRSLAYIFFSLLLFILFLIYFDSM